MRHYHIHITAKDQNPPKGWKKTEIYLEVETRKETHEMFTLNIKGNSNSIEEDVEYFKKFKKLFTDIQRFKVELISQSKDFKTFNPVTYREIHIKTKIPNIMFPGTKKFLLGKCSELKFALSSNPRERNQYYTTQFINMRHREGTFEESQTHLNQVLGFLEAMDIKISEVKDEVNILDDNFNMDAWWAA